MASRVFALLCKLLHEQVNFYVRFRKFSLLAMFSFISIIDLRTTMQFFVVIKILK